MLISKIKVSVQGARRWRGVGVGGGGGAGREQKQCYAYHSIFSLFYCSAKVPTFTSHENS